MKKLTILLALLCAAAFAQQKGTFTDSRDGKKYKTVKIGTQTWMAENLNFEAPGSVCPENKPASCQKYGRLYDWTTAMAIDKQYADEWWKGASYIKKEIVNYVERKELIGSDIKHQGICPSSWHLPNDAEWKILKDFTGDDGGKKLKATSGWADYKWEEWTGEYYFDKRDGLSKKKMVKKSRSGNGTDSYGFSALPVGIAREGSFNSSSSSVLWWSATESGYNWGGQWSLGNTGSPLLINGTEKNWSLPIRCVMD